MLRLAVQARKRYLSRMILASNFYKDVNSVQDLSYDLQRMTLSELEERWKMIQSMSEDQIN